MGTQIIPVAAQPGINIIVSLARSIWTEHYVPIIGQEQVDYMLAKFQSEEAIELQIKEEGYSYYLIYSGDRPVGYLGTKRKNNELFLSKLYVLESERGKGIGRTGVDFLAAECLENGVEFITLTVNKNNLQTIHAYEKMGFDIYGEMIGDIGSGYVMDDFLMRKRIYPG
jgi:ribosomal protein S18 acetylase RimI-like enzyme